MDEKAGRKKIFWRYAGYIAGTLGIGSLSALLSRGGMEAFSYLKKPAFAPPDWVFPVVWTVLYALMGIGAARVWLSPPSPARSKGLNLYVLQLIVNFFWSLIFFNAQAYFLALLWLMLLWALVFGMTLFFYQADLPAAKLQIPYRVWLIYAAHLNLGVWYLNS